MLFGGDDAEIEAKKQQLIQLITKQFNIPFKELQDKLDLPADALKAVILRIKEAAKKDKGLELIIKKHVRASFAVASSVYDSISRNPGTSNPTIALRLKLEEETVAERFKLLKYVSWWNPRICGALEMHEATFKMRTSQMGEVLARRDGNTTAHDQYKPGEFDKKLIRLIKKQPELAPEELAAGLGTTQGHIFGRLDALKEIVDPKDRLAIYLYLLITAIRNKEIPRLTLNNIIGKLEVPHQRAGTIGRRLAIVAKSNKKIGALVNGMNCRPD